jgi:hypothetical protein
MAVWWLTGVADALPDRTTSLVYLDAFVPKNGEALVNFVPPGTPPPAFASEYTLAPLPASSWGASAEVAAVVDARTTPMPIACFTQALRLNGGIDRVKKKGADDLHAVLREAEGRSGLAHAHAAVHAHRADGHA